jgi:segregation and condensation protein A
MSERFTIKAGEFEGPLEVLLELIEKRKLHINDVALSKVSDDFLAYVARLQSAGGAPMNQLANFILIASTLMLIKSHSLLPNLTLTQEEQQSIEDLEHRLKEYQRIKDLSLHIKERFGARVVFGREPSKNIQPVFTPTDEVKKERLLEAIKNILISLPKKEIIPQTVVKKIISLEEVIQDLTKRVQGALRMKFSDFSKENRHEKVNVIVGFLGLLELVKQGIIEVSQSDHFEEIEMESNAPGVPRY